MASLAPFESALIGEQLRTGMRPPIPEATRKTIEELARQGRSIKASPGELGVGYGTAWTYVRAMERA